MDENTKLALERYRNVIGYLQYENTVYWTRSGFLLTAEAALLGFNARVVPATIEDITWPALGMSMGLCVVALLICLLGLKMLENSVQWISRWLQLLTAIEPAAYGADLQVFRGMNISGAPGHFARDTAKYVIYVFIGAWTLILVYLSVLSAIKVELIACGA